MTSALQTNFSKNILKKVITAV